jgi:hypothetical protein
LGIDQGPKGVFHREKNSLKFCETFPLELVGSGGEEWAFRDFRERGQERE